MLADRQAYIVMELLQGKSLRQVLETDHRLSAERAISIALQLCDGLEAAHAKGIIHRDLKPNNIMVTDSDVVKIIDFGLSRVLISSPVSVTEHLTKTGLLIESVNYMSPEQCCGKNADRRSDIYSLGCILYEVLTGKQPFEADTPIGLLHRHLVAAPQPLAETGFKLPPGLDTVIEKALAKDPDLRYQSVSDMKKDLVLVLQGKGALIPKFSLNKPDVSSPQSSWTTRQIVGKVSSICIFLLTLLATSYLINPPPQPPTIRPRDASGMICYLDLRAKVNSQTSWLVKEVHLSHLKGPGDESAMVEKFVGAISLDQGQFEKLQVGNMCSCHEQDGMTVIKLDKDGPDCSGAVTCLFDFLSAVDKKDWKKALSYVDCETLHGGRYDLKWLKDHFRNMKLRQSIKNVQETRAIPELSRLLSKGLKITLCRYDLCVHIVLDRSILFTKEGKPIEDPMLQRYLLSQNDGRWIITIIGAENNMKDMEAWETY